MNLANVGTADLVGAFVGFVLTLCVFSYILGDNPLFRVASYLFVGAAAGFVAVAAFYSVIWPRLLQPLLFGSQPERLMALVPLLLCILMMLRIFPRFSGLASPALAYLVGVGAATAIGGAVLGTIFPQIGATASAFDVNGIASSGKNVALELLNGLIILAGVVLTLGYFQFGQRARPDATTQRSAFRQIFYWGGGAFIAMTFGVLFANVYATAMAALVERLGFLVNLIRSLI
jgi:hypothetical protein